MGICSRAGISVLLTGQVWAICNRRLRVLVVLGILAVAVCVFDTLQISATTCVSEGPDYFKWVTVSITFQAVFAACVMVLTLLNVRRMVNWRDNFRSFGTETQFKYARLVVTEKMPFELTHILFRIEVILVTRLLFDLHGAVATENGSTTSYHLSSAEIVRDRRHVENVGVHVDFLDSEANFELQSVR
ncbi:hypothetical protein K439DRAFT_1631962 [Ramaria rubella]|nr:hypothetical protein K439DRAFT_1631962 [Ramaria rubella]